MISKTSSWMDQSACCVRTKRIFDAKRTRGWLLNGNCRSSDIRMFSVRGQPSGLIPASVICAFFSLHKSRMDANPYSNTAMLNAIEDAIKKRARRRNPYCRTRSVRCSGAHLTRHLITFTCNASVQSREKHPIPGHGCFLSCRHPQPRPWIASKKQDRDAWLAEYSAPPCTKTA